MTPELHSDVNQHFYQLWHCSTCLVICHKPYVWPYPISPQTQYDCLFTTRFCTLMHLQ